MYSVYRKSCLQLDTNYFQTNHIQSYLTRVTQDYQTTKEIISEFFVLEENNLYIPRYFPITRFLNSVKVIDNSEIGDNIKIESKIILRNQLQKDTVRYMVENDSGIIQLSPGSGKTIISIHSICLRKKKTLILVHRKSLVDQWIDRLVQFTNLNRDDIDIFKSSKILESFKKPITVSTVQSFLSCITKNPTSKEIIKKSKIGICILDEAHTTAGAKKFAQVSLYIPSRVNFGLSATPFRKDSGDIIRYHLGEIFHPDGESGTMNACVRIILFDFRIVKKKGKTNRYFYWNNKFQDARYLTQMKKSQILLDVSKKFLLKAIEKNRDILFISKRISIIDFLYSSIDYQDKSKFISNSSNESLNHKLVFSTPGKIRDGVDCPSKDFLITISPISNIEQLTGRIVRYIDGKKTPVIIDFVDTGCKDISRTIHKRIKFYKLKNWDLLFYTFVDDKIQKINELEIHHYI